MRRRRIVDDHDVDTRPDGDVSTRREVTDHEEEAVPRSSTYVDDEVVVSDGPRWYELDVAGRINAVLFAVLAAIESLLVLRFMLVAFGANRSSGFVDFVLDVSWPFVRPFDGAFNNRTWDEGVVEVSTLLAMGVWALIFGIVALLVAAVVPRMDEHAGGGRTHRRRVTHAGH